jgi:hypothetical protein
MGNDGKDYLEGRAGADTLIGGRGRDVMSAGTDSQRDTFVFQSVEDSSVGSTARDIVQSFERGEDKIDLSAIDANAQVAGQQGFSWGGTTAGAYRVWTTPSSSNTLLRGDVTGDGVADFEIQVNAVSGLSSSDLILGSSPVSSGSTAPTTPTSPTGTLDTVSVRIQGDAWKGDPVFDLLVNGAVIKTGVAVTADRVDGEWDTFTFQGDFHLDGSDRVSVRFTNNLNEGTGMDRNLYVDQVTLNGEMNGLDQKLVYNTTVNWDF